MRENRVNRKRTGSVASLFCYRQYTTFSIKREADLRDWSVKNLSIQQRELT